MMLISKNGGASSLALAFIWFTWLEWDTPFQACWMNFFGRLGIFTSVKGEISGMLAIWLTWN